MDKQKQIEEMTKKMKKCYEKNGLLNFKWFAEALYNAGYRKIPENAVVLTREEKEVSIKAIEDKLADYYFLGCSYGAIVSGKMSIDIAKRRAKAYAPVLYGFIQQAVKDTAKEIWVKAKHFYKQYPLSTEVGFCCFRDWVKERYGVEVE